MKDTITSGKKMIPVENIINAAQRIKGVAYHTPFMHNINLSDQYEANIFLKREDLQVVRSYKLRGAYNKISSLQPSKLTNGVVCASAGNHAQGVAYACNKLGIKGYIYMPNPTPKQKVKQVQMFGKEHVHIELVGDTFDDAYAKAMAFCQEQEAQFIPPFDDEKIIEGQGTVGYEILQDTDAPIDYLFVPIGGGGLSAGVGSYFKQVSPHTKIIGLEPAGAPAMIKSLEQGEVITLDKIDKFVDGAAVKRVGDLNYNVCQHVLDDAVTIPEGKICDTILKLYNEEAIVVEPAGAMSIAALDFFKDEIKGKNVCCVVSGGNNDITRMEEIKERALLYNGLKHYFIIRFPQRAGALKEFVAEVLGPNDDITHFEYTKKNNRERGPAMVGIELQSANDYEGLIKRLNAHHIAYQVLNDKFDFFHFLI
ncbi:threonine ammonia-lyase [Porifericola rhodea]|uniref:threonine ammonia-lyase n=1 Tax=Porifericola rhodea TaxID=930972 RepID=UPI00266602F9|nr:threonine ammonia-lyase [Porifericola rhodea]WKN31129.1 threonine ammonia-lyase [Porifericola rhodea]